MAENGNGAQRQKVIIDPWDDLYRKDPLTKEEWIKLIERLVVIIKPYFDKNPLPSLEDLMLLRVKDSGDPNSFYLTKLCYSEDQPEIFSESQSGHEYSLGTHGIFHHDCRETCFVPERTFWGLTKYGTFVKGRIFNSHKNGNIFAPDKLDRVKIVEAEDVEDLLEYATCEGIDAYKVYCAIAVYFEHWVERLEIRMQKLREMMGIVREESVLIRQISGGATKAHKDSYNAFRQQ